MRSPSVLLDAFGWTCAFLFLFFLLFPVVAPVLLWLLKVVLTTLNNI